ncbi:reverse transcriptase [Senna tora]|uniref:Reverse transcriptase n=1 Tax=Senna tora TaxID=362788 RepID=A0A834TF34_9FABA|nr:reverse transcriptase [Senna tora]
MEQSITFGSFETPPTIPSPVKVPNPASLTQISHPSQVATTKNPSVPEIPLSSDEVHQLHSPWVSTIIVRLVALLHGSTTIFGHLLSIKLWSPAFNPELEQSPILSPVWIKLNHLPIEFFNPQILVKIGNTLGTFLGVDASTHNLQTGCCARICALLELSKPIPPELIINGYHQPILVEGISKIFLYCGGAYHPSPNCPGKKPLVPQTLSKIAPPTTRQDKPESNDQGWSLVRRKKSNQPSTSPGIASNGTFPQPTNLNSNLNSNSGQQRHESNNSFDPSEFPALNEPQSQTRGIIVNHLSHTPNTCNTSPPAPPVAKTTHPSSNSPDLETHTAEIEQLLVLDIITMLVVRRRAIQQRQQRLRRQIRQREHFASHDKIPMIVPLMSYYMGSPNPAHHVILNIHNNPAARIQCQWRIWENFTLALITQASWLQAWARLMMESQLQAFTNVLIKDVMKDMKDNGLALVFPPNSIQSQAYIREPQMDQALFRTNQLLTISTVHSYPMESVIKGNLAEGALVFSTNSVRTIDVCVTSFLKLDTGILKYKFRFTLHLSLKPDENIQMLGAVNSSNSDEVADSVGQNYYVVDTNMTPLTILIWNARGAASAEFRRVIHDLKTRHKPHVLFISETRVGGTRVEQIINSLGFDCFHKVDPMGYAGGMWLLWDTDSVRANVYGHAFQEIHATLQVNNSELFLASFIYASPIRDRRKVLWNNLMNLSDIVSLPWLICGDFNDVLSPYEKWGGNAASTSRIRDFKNCIDYCGLFDLGFVGHKFTWYNKRPDGHTVFERLDRFLANHQWLTLFPEATNHHLPRIKSDHNPLLLCTIPSPSYKPKRPFKCEQIWLSQPDFLKLVQSTWAESNSIPEGLKLIQDRAIEWNKYSFGNIFQNKRKLLNRLNGITKALSIRHNPWLVSLENSLSKEYQKILLLEEELWASKSRIDWLTLGDSNTSFFHSSVIHRRRSNHIIALKDSAGNWLHDPLAIRNNITFYFETCFKQIPILDLPTEIIFPNLPLNSHPILSRIPSEDEIHNALWSLKPYKAAGIDGFQPAFFHKCWDMLKSDIIPYDVLLFSRVDDKSINSIAQTLDLFQLCSGLSINKTKSNIWFSPNTTSSMKSKAISILKFNCHDTPGTYLGFPLGIKGKVRDFNPILEKIKARMQNWRAKHLSMAGKVTLINSVISPIASFFMQCIPFPVTVCNTLDKIQRDFFWWSNSENKKVHTICWSKISTPKSFGGLNIFKTRERNISLLAKLSWQVKNNPQKIWAKSIAHYLLNPNCRNLSLTGKGLIHGQQLLNLGMAKIIYSGRNTNFFLDNWSTLHPLWSCIEGSFNRNDSSLTVSDVANDLGDWQWDKLSFDLPQSIKNIINAIPVFKNSNQQDLSVWKYHVSGTFNLKSAYLLCRNLSCSSEHINHSWIWHLKCHSRLKYFIWACFNEALPTRKLLHDRGVQIPFICPLCDTDSESTTHILRDCPISTKLNRVLNQQRSSSTWPQIKPLMPPLPAAFSLNGTPPTNWFKINTDGACSGNPGPFAIGGVIRNSHGNWVHGFSSFVGDGTAIKAEIWAIIVGLKLAKSFKYDHIFIESDSLLALNLINKGDVHQNHHLNNLIMYCRSILLTFNEVQTGHTYREGNSCADGLAKTALLNRSPMTHFASVPSFAEWLFWQTYMGSLLLGTFLVLLLLNVAHVGSVL